MEKQRKNVKTTEAGMSSTQKSKSVERKFSAKNLALMATFVALSYAVSFLEIPLFPATPFLKLDFGNVFVLLISFLLGPVQGVIVCFLKELLRAFSSTSGGVGEIANVLMTCGFILLPALLYRSKKGLKKVIWALLGGCVLGIITALLVNRFITFPLYMGEGAGEFFAKSFWFIVAFNLIKTLSVSALTLLLYKRLSDFFKKLR